MTWRFFTGIFLLLSGWCGVLKLEGYKIIRISCRLDVIFSKYISQPYFDDDNFIFCLIFFSFKIVDDTLLLCCRLLMSQRTNGNLDGGQKERRISDKVW